MNRSIKYLTTPERRSKMNNNSSLFNRSQLSRSESLRRQNNLNRFLRMTFLLSFLFSLALLITGCPSSLKLLDKFKKETAAGNYEWIAAQAVDCTDASEDCRQLHLIKGDACYNLAKQGKDKLNNYALAAEELAQGIEMTRNWSNTADRNQYYENWCESLRNLQDLQSGQEASATGAKFLSAAEKFLQTDPNSFAAIYFTAKARMRQTQKKLLDVNDTNRAQICGELNGLSQLAEDGAAKGQAAGGASWERYKANYDLLKKDVNNSKRAANCP